MNKTPEIFKEMKRTNQYLDLIVRILLLTNQHRFTDELYQLLIDDLPELPKNQSGGEQSPSTASLKVGGCLVQPEESSKPCNSDRRDGSC